MVGLRIRSLLGTDAVNHGLLGGVVVYDAVHLEVFGHRGRGPTSLDDAFERPRPTMPAEVGPGFASSPFDRVLKPPMLQRSDASEFCGGQRSPLRNGLRPPSGTSTVFAKDGGRSGRCAMHGAATARSRCALRGGTTRRPQWLRREVEGPAP